MSDKGWLVFASSLPSRNPNARVKTWRKLQALGAVQLKGSVYILPETEAHLERLGWLVQEVESMEGEAILIRCPSIENIPDDDVRAAFARQRDQGYDELEAEARALLARLADPVRPRSGPGPEEREAKAALRRFSRRLEAIKEIDFFPSGRAGRVEALLGEIERSLGGSAASPVASGLLDAKEWQGKTWTTREHPYVDRLASFWLVRRFIDPQARIAFARDEKSIERREGVVTFDVKGGDFTHEGERITFETIIARFGLAGRGLERLRRVVRAIDVQAQDESLDAATVQTVKDLLDGLIQVATDDFDLTDKALAVFDALHATYDR